MPNTGSMASGPRVGGAGRGWRGRCVSLRVGASGGAERRPAGAAGRWAGDAERGWYPTGSRRALPSVGPVGWEWTMDKTVTLFTQPGCAPCHAAKEYLTAMGVTFTERNIRQDAAAYKE